MKANSIAGIRERILNGEISLPEVTQEYIARIKAENPAINAFISTRFEEALQQAEIVDKKIKNKTAGPLAGAVIGVKDVISERGKPMTGASRIMQNFESVYDATVIEKLKNDDAIIIGRLNMDEFAMGSTNESSYFGPVKNPHNPDKVPGGSSGGSAAAVAAGMITAALGSDTGGSIRLPASYCGVVGLKPTYGRVSRFGMMAYASSFDSIGPIAANAEDAALLLQSMAGRDSRDSTSADVPAADFAEVVRNPVKNIKIGVPDIFFSDDIDAEIKHGVQKVLAGLEADGAELIPVELPHSKYAIAAYYIIATGEASSNLSRFDGIRYGYRADKAAVLDELKAEEAALNERLQQAGGSEKEALEKQLSSLDSQLNRLYKKTRGEGFGPNVKRRVLLGTYMLSSGQYERYYVKAQKVRRLIQQDFSTAFEKVDVIVSPSAPTTAISFGSGKKYTHEDYVADLLSNTANLAGICGISVPAGVHSNGLPYGIQFMGDVFQEAKILNAARLVELKTA